MMQDNITTLIMNRLAVYRKGRAVYDEQFHEGVNIIRGSNSSGKSTIADFIFFVLGGDFTNWKPEAEECDFVFAEVQINGGVLTLKREISKSSRRGMGIFWGNFDSALESTAEGWQYFPFQRTANTMSFSQLLFKAMGLPEVRGDADSNITMHQLLRMLYVDQLSGVQSLLRDERFDAPLTRRTVGDLLLGIYDDSIYSDELALRGARKDLESIENQLRALQMVFKETDQEIELSQINDDIKQKEGQLEKISVALQDYDLIKEIPGESISEEIEHRRKHYVSLQDDLANLRNNAHRLLLDIEDSQLFIKNMENRAQALDQASIARDSLSEMKINQCPLCLATLEDNAPEGFCYLCKNPVSVEAQKTRVLRMKQEILFQIRESEEILKGKKNEYNSIARGIPRVAEEVTIAKLKLEEELRRVRTTRSKHLDELLTKKGQLESEILSLHRQAKAVLVFQNLSAQKRNVDSSIQSLAISIEGKRAKQKSRLDSAFGRIDAFARALLRADLIREETFKNPDAVRIDFEKNTFWVNGRNDFSASSIVYLKNSVHYAIFLASLELDFFRYPRFILCDNMEDKGMEEARSQNFQRAIVKIASKYSVPFQLIFTTSMIDPSLDNTDYCVGQKYSEENKSLKL